MRKKVKKEDSSINITYKYRLKSKNTKFLNLLAREVNFCSACFKRTGPSGLSGLGIREWKCLSCGRSHQRDVNAAINIEILGIGHDTPQGKPRI